MSEKEKSTNSQILEHSEKMHEPTGEWIEKQQQQNKPYKKKKPINWTMVISIIVMVVYLIVSITVSLHESKEIGDKVTLNEIYKMVDNGEIESATVNRNDKTVMFNTKDNKHYLIANPDSDLFLENLMKKDVIVTVQYQTKMDSILKVLQMLPLIVIMAFLCVYIINILAAKNGKLFAVTKSKYNKVRFSDIKGLSKTKSEIQFIVSQMRNWKQLGELGVRPSKGILLYGPPGVGKTMIAKAIAKESDAAFISCSASDFDEMFVGVGASRIRTLFNLAFTNTPCIIFIDEIDSLGKRSFGGGDVSHETNRTINALLQRMDGLDTIPGVMVIGATNSIESLDEALIRPGRFDNQFYIGAPDNKKDRDEVVQYYLENKHLEYDVTVDKVSKLMVGLTGAEIEESMNSAGYISLKDGRNGLIGYRDIDEAIMRLHTKGIESKHSSSQDEVLVSYHEAGHAVMGLLLNEKIAKVSNIPYTNGLGGVTVKDLDETGDKKLALSNKIKKGIMQLLAGNISETIFFGDSSQGAQGDLKRATELVIGLHEGYGLSQITEQKQTENYEQNQGQNQGQNSENSERHNLISERALIENNLQKGLSTETIKDCNNQLSEIYEEAKTILVQHQDLINDLAVMLMKDKTIVAPTIDDLFKFRLNGNNAHYYVETNNLVEEVKEQNKSTLAISDWTVGI